MAEQIPCDLGSVDIHIYLCYTGIKTGGFYAGGINP